MVANPQFAPLLNHALALALQDDGDECVQAANDFIDEADTFNGWRGALVEAWHDRWAPYREERLELSVLAASSRLKDVLK